MEQKSVSLSGLPGPSKGRQTGHIPCGGIEFPPGFSEPQKAALAALAKGSTLAAAARAAGVHPGTVGRWIRACYAL